MGHALEVRRGGQGGAAGGGNRATNAASVRLLDHLADRFLRHHEPEALLLKGWVREESMEGRALVGASRTHTLFD